MLYLAIPAHNEAATIGVLLWRLRTVLAEFPREYEAVVYDDASSDSTSEILESYAKVMPLTVLRGERQVGYAGAVDALVRHVARDTRYPRRDAMLLLQGDFTDSPWLVPEFIKRFEGGMDVVVGERGRAVRRKAPAPVRRLLQFEPWLTRFLVRADGIRDLTSSYRLIRISVLRDLLRSVGDAPVCVGDARTANADLLMRIVPLARRVEALPVEPTWEIRLRDTRVVAVPDAMNLLRWAWRSRGRRAVPSTAPETSDAPRNLRASRDGRPDLRLEGRSDGVDASVVIESGRNPSVRDASGSRGRKPRAGRNEAKIESRNEVRSESRNEQRVEPRSDGRNETRKEARPQPRNAPRHDLHADATDDVKLDARRDARSIPRAEISSTEADTDLEVVAETTAHERPPRRKRMRGGRRDRAGAETESGTDGPHEATGDRSTEGSEPVVRPAIVSSSEATESAADEPTFVREVELSASLSDAVADIELEIDGGGRTRPPRKKRRRRGSRGGRIGTGAAGGEDAVDGAADFAESNDASGDGSDVADRSDGEDDSASSDFTQGNSATDTDAMDAGGDAEDRVRRRGRRGRRGGSRRSRSPRGETENSSGGEDFSVPPPPAHAPAPAPED